MADFYGVWYQGFCTNCADLNTWAYAPKDLCFTNVPGSSPPTCGLASFKDCSPAGRCEAGECMVSSGAGGAGRGCMHGCVLTQEHCGECLQLSGASSLRNSQLKQHTCTLAGRLQCYDKDPATGRIRCDQQCTCPGSGTCDSNNLCV